MKILEILNEGGTGSLAPGVARALPATFEFPELANQDPYLQYRMGVALASARSGQPMNAESAFGENMSIIAYTEQDEEIIKLAAKLLGTEAVGQSKLISTKRSEEAADVNTTSPSATPKRNKYGI